METYRLSNKTAQHFKSTFSQNGKGLNIDRYIYSQEGAGVGSFFAKLFRSVLPIAKTAINTGYKIAKPHIQKAGEEVYKEGKRAFTNKASEVLLNKKQKLDNLIKGAHNE